MDQQAQEMARMNPRDPVRIDRLIGEMVDAIAQETNPERVYIFGSHATGNVTPDSDVDLLVVQDEDFGLQRRRWEELRRIRRRLAAFRIPKDILLYSHREFDLHAKSPNHVIGRCLREGKLLYERH